MRRGIVGITLASMLAAGAGGGYSVQDMQLLTALHVPAPCADLRAMYNYRAGKTGSQGHHRSQQKNRIIARRAGLHTKRRWYRL